MNNDKRRFNVPGLKVITNIPMHIDLSRIVNPPPENDPNLKKQDYLVRKMVFGTALGFVMLELTNGITYIVDGTLISRFLGDDAFAACGMTGLCYSIIAMICSMFVGEKDKTSVKQTFLSGVRYIMFSIIPVAIVYFILAPYIARIYNDPGREYFAMAVLSLRMHAISLPFLAFNEMYNSYVQALERIKLSHLLTFCSRFLYISLTSLVLSRLFGVYGLMVAILIATGVLNSIKPVEKSNDSFRVLNKTIEDQGAFLEISLTDGEQLSQMMTMVESFSADCIDDDRKKFFVKLFCRGDDGAYS